jgi:hypothetical protein
MSAHTPGPWRIKEMPNREGLICVVPDNNLAVADCCDIADARLIAAAPELLAALLDVLDADGDLYAMDFDRYRAVIAKAMA